MSAIVLIRGWPARLLLAVAGGMTAAFLLVWLYPATYVAASYVTSDRAQINGVLAYATSGHFVSAAARDLNVPAAELEPVLSVKVNRTGGWLAIEARHQSATAAARIANSAAAAVAASEHGARVLASAEPPTQPVTKTPQGMALLGGALSFVTALCFEFAMAALRRLLRAPLHAADLARSWRSGSGAWAGANDAAISERYVPLPIGLEPTNILVASADESQADALTRLIADRLRANGRPVERSDVSARTRPGPRLHVAGDSEPEVDTVWALPTLDPDLVAAWAAATDRVLVAVEIGETSDRELRHAVGAVEGEGRTVDAVVALERRRPRSTIAPEECEWVVMD